MGKIIATGEKKKILGKWYQKQNEHDGYWCEGCSFSNGGNCLLPNMIEDTHKAIEDGGSECSNTIWVVVDAPKKPSKPVPKAIWSTKFLSIHPKSTKADLAKLLQESVGLLNETGTKLAKAQNTITRLRKATK